ncbi:hypothetical protein G6F65_020637 [Rhizopus arrhizus]|nr:hypothetical protein G6F68_018529 [Rhizopus microsporus]KAG1246527.1 hypothetical protein G6F65_020637 [Rhizopus arrhizus]
MVHAPDVSRGTSRQCPATPEFDRLEATVSSRSVMMFHVKHSANCHPVEVLTIEIRQDMFHVEHRGRQITARASMPSVNVRGPTPCST